jgi:hypothetical protein
MASLIDQAATEAKYEILARALRQAGGNRTEAARLLGVDIRTVFRLITLAPADTLEAAKHGGSEPEDPLTVVYFILAGSHIKIGTTVRLQKRLDAIKSANPEATLLGAVPGSFPLERQYHHQWKALRVRGEWFKAAPELRAWVEQLCSKNRRKQ